MKIKNLFACYLLTAPFYSHSSVFTIPLNTEVVFQATSYNQSFNRQTIPIPAGTSLQVYNYLYVNASAGDTFFIDATTQSSNGYFSRTPIQFNGLAGNSVTPIVIKNTNGKKIHITQASNQSSYGLVFYNCNYIKVTGYENGTSFNLKISGFTNNAGMGIIFDKGTKNVELEHTEISYTGAQGVQFKSIEPYNGSKVVTDTNYFRSYVNQATLGTGLFHDNYIHNIHSEGFYIGSTAYNVGDGLAIKINQTFAESLTKNGIVNYNNGSWRFLPHLAENILVYNNIIDSTGWDGIQVACAKNYKIYNNKISNWGYNKIYNQMYGIIVGAPSIGEVFNNSLKVGNGSAIQCFGVQNRFFNNLIVNANIDSKEATWWAINSIYLSDKSCTPQVLSRLGLTYSQTLFEAAHNTIIMHPNDSGRAISFFQTFPKLTIAKSYNNLVVKDPWPTVLNTSSVTFPNPIIVANPQQTNFSVANNYIGNDIQMVGFANEPNGNYDLIPNCVACRNALPLKQAANDKIYLDYNNSSRKTNATTNTSISKPSFGCFETEN